MIGSLHSRHRKDLFGPARNQTWLLNFCRWWKNWSRSLALMVYVGSTTLMVSWRLLKFVSDWMWIVPMKMLGLTFFSYLLFKVGMLSCWNIFVIEIWCMTYAVQYWILVLSSRAWISYLLIHGLWENAFSIGYQSCSLGTFGRFSVTWVTTKVTRSSKQDWVPFVHVHFGFIDKPVCLLMIYRLCSSCAMASYY